MYSLCLILLTGIRGQTAAGFSTNVSYMYNAVLAKLMGPSYACEGWGQGLDNLARRGRQSTLEKKRLIIVRRVAEVEQINFVHFNYSNELFASHFPVCHRGCYNLRAIKSRTVKVSSVYARIMV